MNNYLLFLFIVLLLILTIGLGGSFYLTHRFGRKQVHSPADYGLDFAEPVFPAADGLLLQGAWIPYPGSQKAVVILHGHGGSLDWDLHRAPALHEAGFNVLLFDFRAHGRSRGQVASFGYLERGDVQGAVQFLQEQGMRHIGLLGFSYGGIAAMLSAPVCPEVEAIISDGGPARQSTAVFGRLKELGLPGWLAKPLAWWTLVCTGLRLGVNYFRYEPVRWVGKIAPRPVLFVHGELDQYLPDFDDLYAAANQPKEAWRLPGVGHTQATEVEPLELQRRVIDFFTRALA
jgi:pimeloyl-ACP methyl ester carboxylesterase